MFARTAALALDDRREQERGAAALLLRVFVRQRRWYNPLAFNLLLSVTDRCRPQRDRAKDGVPGPDPSGNGRKGAGHPSRALD
jgi:hypothetical protein